MTNKKMFLSSASCIVNKFERRWSFEFTNKICGAESFLTCVYLKQIVSIKKPKTHAQNYVFEVFTSPY